VPLSTQEYKWVLANCWGNLTNCREVTCDGLASRPGGVEILLAASCYRNRDELSSYRVLHSHKGFYVLNSSTPTLLEIPVLVPNFHVWLLNPASPLEFPAILSLVGMDIFWDCIRYFFPRNSPESLKVWLFPTLGS